MANTSQEPGPLPGTVTVISLLTLMPSSHVDGKNVTCRVEHESFEEPVALPMTLTVPCEWTQVTMGPLPPSAVAQGARLLIHTVDESINTTFICLVTNALGTGQAEVTVLVTGLPREPSHSGLSSKIIIILTFTIMPVGTSTVRLLMGMSSIQLLAVMPALPGIHRQRAPGDSIGNEQRESSLGL
ncbi:hypothetical protein E2I00_009955, partial [Balaenoptera physalus]